MMLIKNIELFYLDAKPSVSTLTFAPASANTLPHASSVAPVVITSSTSNKCRPAIFAASGT
jgi:hypothetical protein